MFSGKLFSSIQGFQQGPALVVLDHQVGLVAFLDALDEPGDERPALQQVKEFRLPVEQVQPQLECCLPRRN